MQIGFYPVTVTLRQHITQVHISHTHQYSYIELYSVTSWGVEPATYFIISTKINTVNKH
jgi:hypothetical protein